MNKTNDKIELRSEKVRNIIGQIPPIIIRTGISIIFCVILILLICSWFFKYEYTIKSTGLISEKNDMLLIDIKIPANEISKIKIGQLVILSFNEIPNLYNEKIFTEIQVIPNKIEVSDSGGFYSSMITLPKETRTESGKELHILQPTSIISEIITDKVSFFDRLTKPIKSIFSKRKQTKIPNSDYHVGYRNVPSTGGLFPLEIYTTLFNSQIEAGLYHYQY